MTGAGRRTARSSKGKYSSDGGNDDGGDVSRRSSRRNAKSHKDNKRRDGSSSLIRMLNVDLKIMIAICGAASLIIVFLIYNLMIIPVEVSQRPSVVTPFPSPKLMDLPQFQGKHKESLYWGTYRPQVYFGVRARTPRSLVAGLMWLGVKDGRYEMRHVCQNSDELSKYGWIAHNGRDFGKQELVEQELKLETSFLKSRSPDSGYGGDWAVQIDVQHEKSGSSNELLRTGHLFFYLADESGNALSLSKDANENHETSLLASGSRADVGEWQVHLNSKDTLEVHHSGFRTPYIHNLSDLVLQDLGAQVRDFGRLQLPDSAENSANILVFQVSARIPFRTEIVFVSGTEKKDSTPERVRSLTGASLSSQLQLKQTKFDSKFVQLFNGTKKLESESAVVGKAAIANMLGGIGYFYGQSKIAYPDVSHLQRDTFISYWPAELYTAVPSRPFFPRGFLWDEGFHQLLIWRWDLRISLDIVGHWLDLMNIDGWIPREQILGSEARSKVPEEFIPQYPSNGNPPTLFLVINDLLDGIEKNLFTDVERRDITSFLERAFVRLEAWYQWFNTTQSGKQMSSYFWHGRDNKTSRELNPKTLSSGLDDYPRASHPNDDERHVDLRCWMLLAAKCMQSISKFFENGNRPGKEYASTVKLLSNLDLLNEMHLDPTSGAYFDFGNHTEKVKVIRDENNHARRELVREVLERPELRLVPHVGFVSLFPFMGKIIPPDSWILEKQLDMISNRRVLWSDYGLRSLARSSSIYMKRNTEHDAPYWRGPIWMNMNYMALSALHHYSRVDGPYSERAGQIYRDLRSNLIRNVVRNYNQTGYLWEQYDQMKGKGQGTRLFTGWTALVLLIMGEAYT
ncbi:Mannosyl-oligosaccharide glucosidase GCS1 [Linum perenne]